MSDVKKCAVYGGTFNPPHIGHIRAAEAFFDAVKPNELLIIPTLLPPHKDARIDCTPEQRLKMCELAFSHISGASVSDIEIKRGGKSYTYMTLRELSLDNRELYFLCGTDMFLTLDTWRCPEIIFALAKICFIRREDDNDNNPLIVEKTKLYKEKYGAEIILIDSDTIELSSTDIRRAIRNDLPLNDMLSHGVAEYIKKEGLYK